MIVAFDGHGLFGERTGVPVYMEALIRALARQGRREDRFALYFFSHRHDPPCARLRRDLGIEAWRSHVPYSVAKALWRRFGGPPVERLLRPADIFHANFTPPVARRSKVVATIHDLYFMKRPEECGRERGRSIARYLEARITCADLILADSQATRRDIERFFPRVADRTRVVYPGGGAMRDLPPPERAAAIRKTLGLPEPYALFVGLRHPRKNLLRLLQAYAMAAERDPELCALVLAGPASTDAHEAALRAKIASAPAISARLKLLGYLADDEIAALYAGARALLLPSLDEGFGLPVLEAFRAGIPVLASNAGAIPEVAGDAALLVDPLDAREIAEGLLRVLGDEGLRALLVARGTEQAARFSWERAAQEVRSLYEGLLGGRL